MRYHKHNKDPVRCLWIFLIPTTDNAMSISHDFKGIAGNVGYTDAQQLYGLIYVPQLDVLIRAGCK